MDYLIYFYPTIITIGIATCYTDIRFHVIKNRHILRAAIAGIATYAYLALTHKITLEIWLLLNLLAGVGIGLLLYTTNAWGGGDAKLFMLFCLLMPTQRYKNIIPLPSLVVFMNTFLLSTVVIMANSIALLFKNRQTFSFKGTASQIVQELARSLVIIFCLDWIIRLFTDPIRPYLTPFLTMLLLYFSYWLVYGGIERIKNRALVASLLGMAALIRFIVNPAELQLLPLITTLRRVGTYALIFNIIRIIFEQNRDRNDNTNKIAFAPLILAGTLLSQTTLLYWIMEIMRFLKR